MTYQIIRKGTGWSQYGPDPDRVLSRHKTEAAAQRAFDRLTGHAVLIGPDGSQLNHRIV